MSCTRLGKKEGKKEQKKKSSDPVKPTNFQFLPTVHARVKPTNFQFLPTVHAKSSSGLRKR